MPDFFFKFRNCCWRRQLRLLTLSGHPLPPPKKKLAAPLNLSAPRGTATDSTLGDVPSVHLNSVTPKDHCIKLFSAMRIF